MFTEGSGVIAGCVCWYWDDRPECDVWAEVQLSPANVYSYGISVEHRGAEGKFQVSWLLSDFSWMSL